MKFAPKSLLIALAGAAVMLTGCAKKPLRPDPSATLGPAGGGPGLATNSTALNPTDVSAPADANSALQNRGDSNILEDANTIRGLLQPVYFDFDRSSIKASERDKLKAAKDYLDKNPQYRLLLEGHCDWRGTAEYNLGLGDRRANAAKNYLLTLGVSADRIETLSKGSEEAKKEGGDAIWAKDRRDELVVLKK